MLLRPAVPDDMATVADVWHRAWHLAHRGHVPDGLTAARTLAGFHERTPSRVADTTVADVDGRVVGFTMVVGDEVEQVGKVRFGMIVEIAPFAQLGTQGKGDIEHDAYPGDALGGEMIEYYHDTMMPAQHVSYHNAGLAQGQLTPGVQQIANEKDNGGK